VQFDAKFCGQPDQASATARVPPRGYQTPSPVCRCAMLQSTAGERSGAEPTYCVKWSSIWETRRSFTKVRMVAPTVLQGRIRRTSPSVAKLAAVVGSNMSRTEPIDRQKK